MQAKVRWREPAGSVSISELFDVPDSIRAIYDAASSDVGDIESGISSDKIYVTLMPKSAGTATIKVTAADTAAGGGTASVSFDATVVAQASIAAKSQAEVDKVFMDAGAGSLVAGGAEVMVDASMLFTAASSAKPVYAPVSDKADVLTVTGYTLDTDDATAGAHLSGTLDVDSPSFTAEVTPPANDGDRVDDTVTATAYSGTVGDATEEASRSFVVADAHALPAPAAVTVEARDASGRAVTSVSEGGAVELTVSVDRGRGAATATGEALSA